VNMSSFENARSSIVPEEVREEIEAVLSVYEDKISCKDQSDESIVIKHSTAACVTSIKLPLGYPNTDPIVVMDLKISTQSNQSLRSEVLTEIRSVIAENTDSCRLFMIIECLGVFEVSKDSYIPNDLSEEEVSVMDTFDSIEYAHARPAVKQNCSESDCSVEVIHGELYTERKRYSIQFMHTNV